VGELQLNVRLIESILIQYGRCEPAESMPRHAVSIAKPVERVKDRVVAHRLFFSLARGNTSLPLPVSSLSARNTSTASARRSMGLISAAGFDLQYHEQSQTEKSVMCCTLSGEEV
jgi:hypothetical protein